MSQEAVTELARLAVMRPRTQFAQLGHDHVPFDRLTGSDQFETKALREISRESVCACVIGPSGAGKSSVISWVCLELPNTHIALRVPISALEDATKVAEVSSLALATALDAIALEEYQRNALERARADQVMTERGGPGIASAKLGGGPVPAEVNVELGTLREQLARGLLAGDRIAGLDRLIQILVAHERTPVFVFEDTEAAIGGGQPGRVEGFFAGPLQTFMQEVDAPLLLAVQQHLTEESRTFARLAPSMSRIQVPVFGDTAREAIVAILRHRIALEELDFQLEDAVEDDAIDVLLALYEETRGNLRLMLAAAHSAAEYAAEAGSDCIRAPHARAGVSDWR